MIPCLYGFMTCLAFSDLVQTCLRIFKLSNLQTCQRHHDAGHLASDKDSDVADMYIPCLYTFLPVPGHGGQDSRCVARIWVMIQMIKSLLLTLAVTRKRLSQWHHQLNYAYDTTINWLRNLNNVFSIVFNFRSTHPDPGHRIVRAANFTSKLFASQNPSQWVQHSHF